VETIIITSFCQECIVLSVLNFNVFFADWPDYTSSEEDSDSEVETIVGGQETESDNVGETTPLENNNSDQQHHKHHHHEHHQHHHPSQDHGPQDIFMVTNSSKTFFFVLPIQVKHFSLLAIC
jgi:G3E family GTPase